MVTTALSKTDEKALDKSVEIIDKARASFNESVIVIGRELANIREILPHGEFLTFVKERCEFEKSTAYNYLSAWELFGTFKRIEAFDSNAILTLAKCKPAAIEAKSLANHGQRIGLEKAKSLVRDSKPDAAARAAKVPRRGSLGDGQYGSGGDQAAESSGGTADNTNSSNDIEADDQPTYTCPNCGGHETDDDGDCAKCHEPAAPAEPEPEPEGGYEPHEAKKPLDKLFKALGDAARACKDAQKILPNCVHLADCFAAIDKASLALHRSRSTFKRRPK